LIPSESARPIEDEMSLVQKTTSALAFPADPMSNMKLNAAAINTFTDHLMAGLDGRVDMLLPLVAPNHFGRVHGRAPAGSNRLRDGTNQGNFLRGEYCVDRPDFKGLQIWVRIAIPGLSQRSRNAAAR
jgi:hypothetical protein